MSTETAALSPIDRIREVMSQGCAYSSVELARFLPISKQTASRRIHDLRKFGELTIDTDHDPAGNRRYVATERLAWPPAPDPKSERVISHGAVYLSEATISIPITKAKEEPPKTPTELGLTRITDIRDAVISELHGHAYTKQDPVLDELLDVLSVVDQALDNLRGRAQS